MILVPQNVWLLHLFSQAGGCKAGTFSIYPHHSDDPYDIPKLQMGKTKRGVFRPSPGPKSKPTSSIVKQNIDRYQLG